MDWEPRVGMRVVCVDDAESFGTLKHGSILTIERVLVDDALFSSRYAGYGVGLLFVEIPPPPHPIEAFHPARFRPLDERRIDVFRQILTKAPTPEKEPV